MNSSPILVLLQGGWQQALLSLLCCSSYLGLMSAFCLSNFSSQLGFCLLCSKHVGLTTLHVGLTTLHVGLTTPIEDTFAEWKTPMNQRCVTGMQTRLLYQSREQSQSNHAPASAHALSPDEFVARSQRQRARDNNNKQICYAHTHLSGMHTQDTW